MDRRDHSASCEMSSEARAAMLAVLQDHVPAIIHAKGEPVHAVFGIASECECGKPEQHCYVSVRTQDGDEAAEFGPIYASTAEAMMVMPAQVEYTERFILPAPLN